jgi:hypothetical protein
MQPEWGGTDAHPPGVEGRPVGLGRTGPQDRGGLRRAFGRRP